MDIKDYRKLVNDSPFKDKLNNIKIVLNYPHLDSKFELGGIQSIYKFIYDQVISWNQLENIPEYLSHSKRHFESLKSKLIQISDYFTESGQNQFDNNWSQFLQAISSPKALNRYFAFLIDSPETDFLIKINNKNPNYSQGAIDYITNSPINFNSGKDYFTGVLFAYEFKNQTESELLHRRNNERISLGQIKEKYNKYIVEAEQHLNGYISDAKENLTTHFENVEKMKEDSNKQFKDWFNQEKFDFEKFQEETYTKIYDLEDLYRHKLKLEAPADYWKKRATLLKTEGKSYLFWLIGVSIIASLFLFILLMSLGNGFFDTAFSDKIKGIKWSIILITIVSLLAFTIKILAKLTFSSFHLSRDAEEREQLTHFYLALKKDTAIEPEERQLILQSLFSRADTGLLKDDSSPTMPTSIIEKFSGAR